MLTAEEHFLRVGGSVPQIHADYPEMCTIGTLYNLIIDFAAGVYEGPKKQKRPRKEIGTKMEARANHVARDLGITTGLSGRSYRRREWTASSSSHGISFPSLRGKTPLLQHGTPEEVQEKRHAKLPLDGRMLHHG